MPTVAGAATCKRGSVLTTAIAAPEGIRGLLESEGLTSSPAEDKGQKTLLSLAKGCQKLVIFSGSGLSAGSGDIVVLVRVLLTFVCYCLACICLVALSSQAMHLLLLENNVFYGLITWIGSRIQHDCSLASLLLNNNYQSLA